METMDSDSLIPKSKVHVAGRDKGISNRWTDIGLSLLMLTVPMLFFSTILLGLIFMHRVVQAPSRFDNLKTDISQTDNSAYYVDLNSTFLIFVASWSSSLAPTLVGFALTLTSYPIAQRMYRNVERQDNESLPTPYQLALLLRFLNNGGLRSLWSWSRYRFAVKRRSQLHAVSLTLVANVVLITTLLGSLVFLADTWLHVATKNVELLQVTPIASRKDYSFGLIPSCIYPDATEMANAPLFERCAVSIAVTGVFLTNNAQSLQVLNNVSESIRVLTFQGRYTYLGVPPADDVARYDYSATTFGMETSCKLVSTKCNLQTLDGADTPFNCTNAWSGDQANTGGQGGLTFSMTYFTDDTMSTRVGQMAEVNNPFHFGIAANVLDLNFSSETNHTSDSEFVGLMHGGYAFLLQCFSTMYDVEYDNVNETVTRFIATPSNSSIATLWQAPAALTPITTTQIKPLVNLASLSRSAQELVDQMALFCSQTILALGSQVVTPRPAVQVQERTSIIVTRIPKAPLFTLVVSNLLFVVVGIVLAIVAWINSGEAAREVQARLSIVGLAANYFEGSRAMTKVEEIEKLFQETEETGYHRAAIGRASQGGYSYKLVWTAATALPGDSGVDGERLKNR